MDCECKHGIPLDWNCNACSDSGDDPRKSEGNMSEAEQYQDELLKQERLLEILGILWWRLEVHPRVVGFENDILFLASALGLGSEFKKHVLGE